MAQKPPPTHRANHVAAFAIPIVTCLVGIGLIALGFNYGPRFSAVGPAHAHEGRELWTAHNISLMLFEYAAENGKGYPTGNSSTEVFQKLIDGDYCYDPTIFYLATAGKVMATSRTLKPENVAWDVTIPVRVDAPEDLPVVFSTGYRLNYAPDGNAVLLIPGRPSGGIIVGYKSGISKWVKRDALAHDDIQNVLDSTFNPQGKTHQQLTPDGPLTP